MILAPEGRHTSPPESVSPLRGLIPIWDRSYQGLAPLAIDCRPSGAKAWRILWLR
jgi:hypothetical protein